MEDYAFSGNAGVLYAHNAAQDELRWRVALKIYILKADLDEPIFIFPHYNFVYVFFHERLFKLHRDTGRILWRCRFFGKPRLDVALALDPEN